jgi:hypothetical protein
VPGQARHDENGSRSSERAGDREDLCDRPLLALRPVDPQREAAREHEQREDDLQVDETAAERRRTQQREQRAERERGA